MAKQNKLKIGRNKIAKRLIKLKLVYIEKKMSDEIENKTGYQAQSSETKNEYLQLEI